jgi:hypothetical protein
LKSDFLAGLKGVQQSPKNVNMDFSKGKIVLISPSNKLTVQKITDNSNNQFLLDDDHSPHPKIKPFTPNSSGFSYSQVIKKHKHSQSP